MTAIIRHFPRRFASLHRLVAPVALFSLASTGLALDAPDQPVPSRPDRSVRLVAPTPVPDQPKVQIAVLLDTSNSMDGLINQAKTQLWAIVNQFAIARRSERPDVRPRIEVALYEYGNDGLPASENYIRLVVPLTEDLDKVSEALFALKTNGGSEFCGAVIDHAARTLDWSRSKTDYKTIFIAGNEAFTQGQVAYDQAVKSAVTRGIVINTLFCGGREEGIATKWEDGAKLGDGSFNVIDQNRTPVSIVTPFDAELAKLSGELNSTYIAYGGREARESAARQEVQDANAVAAAPAAAAQRAATKAGVAYNNAAWDLVDAQKQGRVKLEELQRDELPEAMQKMSVEERKAFVEAQAKKRAELQARIQELSTRRDAFVVEEQKKLAATEAGKADTLDQALIKAARQQAEAVGYTFQK